MSEEVKQEGTFKIKRKPKQLIKDSVIKVDLSKKEEKDAIQIGETKKVDVEKQAGPSAGVDKQVSESKEVSENEKEIVIQEIVEEEKINMEKSKQLMGQQQFDEKMDQNEELAELRADTSLEKTQMGIDAKMVNDMIKQTDVRILKGPRR